MQPIIGKYILVGAGSFILGGLTSLLYNNIYDNMMKGTHEPILNKEIPKYDEEKKEDKDE